MSEERIDKLHLGSTDGSIDGGCAQGLNPIVTRSKLESCSAESRASDSGISAEFSETTVCNGASVHLDADTEDESPELFISPDDEDGVDGKSSNTPVVEEIRPPSLDETRSNPSTAPSSAGVSPSPSTDSPTDWDEITSVLEGLITDHIKNDKHWQPSGRYHINLVAMEEDIGRTLSRKNKAREDARRVLELFLEDSFNDDPMFQPSGHYRRQARAHNNSYKDGRGSTKHDVTSESSSPQSTAGQSVTLRIPSSVTVARPLPSIPQAESAAERGSVSSRLSLQTDSSYLHGGSHQRDSYYCALYDQYEGDDECLHEVQDTLSTNVTLASPEVFDESDTASPISLIPTGQDSTTTAFLSYGDTVRTDVVPTAAGGIHIHQHKETERVVSSSTSLSSILDDGGMSDVQFKDRKKKSLFTMAAERLRHAFNRDRVRRSDSRSENEAERLSVVRRSRKPVRKKIKKKIRVKNGDVQPGNTEILQSHQHRFRIHGTAQATEDGKGLNANIWIDDKDLHKRGIVNKDKASTLPAQMDASGKASKEKESEKAREKREKEMKELMKYAKKARKPNRSESSRSNDSIFKMWTMKKSAKADSPSISRSERKPSFSFSSILRRPKRKDSDQALVPDQLQAEGPPSVELDRKFSERSSSLQVPAEQLRSRSADEIQKDEFRVQAAAGDDQPSLRLVPQHSRSRSAQDATGPYTTEGTSTSSQQVSSSSSPTKQPSDAYKQSSAKSLSPGIYKKQYVPRSDPLRIGSASPRITRNRRHTTQVEAGHMHTVVDSSRPRSHVAHNASNGAYTTDSKSPTVKVAAAGMGMSRAGYSKVKPAGMMTLPLSVDATVSRTQSLTTKDNGQRVLRTVTSVDEFVSVDPQAKRKSDNETDSEIDMIISIPQEKRSQMEKDKLYRHIAKKISKLVTIMESDDGLSSAYNTPMEDSKGFPGSNIPVKSTYVSASSTTSAHGQTETVTLAESYNEETDEAGIATQYQVLQKSVCEEEVQGDGAAAAHPSHAGRSLTETSVTKTSVSTLGDYCRIKGDSIHASNPHFSSMFNSMVMQDLGSYDTFEKMADNVNTRDVPSVQGIAAVFSFTFKAVRLVGKTGELANRVKENALQYIENKFAQYIINNGGWDSMLEESSSEVD